MITIILSITKETEIPLNKYSFIQFMRLIWYRENQLKYNYLNAGPFTLGGWKSFENANIRLFSLVLFEFVSISLAEGNIRFADIGNFNFHSFLFAAVKIFRLGFLQKLKVWSKFFRLRLVIALVYFGFTILKWNDFISILVI